MFEDVHEWTHFRHEATLNITSDALIVLTRALYIDFAECDV